MVDLNDAWYRVSVKGIIYNDNGEILLCKENIGKWDLPGGGLDHGEKPSEGLIREIKEEMGLEVTYVSKTPKFFVTTKSYSSSKQMDLWIANICYEIRVKDLKITPSDECVEVGFFNKNTLEEITPFKNVIDLFDMAFDN